MREAKKKVGVFNKKPTLEIPKNMEITATSKVYENHSKDTVVYSTNQDSCILTPAFMSLVENVDANKTVMIPLEKSKQKVAYKDVDGFFLYEGIVFYRDKGASGRRGAGRTVKDGTSFRYARIYFNRYQQARGYTIDKFVKELMKEREYVRILYSRKRKI